MADEDANALGREVGPREAPAREGLSAGLDRLLAIEPEERSLRRLVSALAAAIPVADSAALLVGEGGDLELAAAVGLDDSTPERVAGGLGAEVLQAGGAGGARVAAGPGAPFPAGTRCGAGALVRAEPPGVLLMGTRGADAFDADDLVLLRIAADRVALALAQGRLERERSLSVEEARRVAEELDSRRKALDYILGVVGHDLRNPLGAIHMSAALLQKRGALEGWQARAVERTRSSAGRMGRIIADLLSYTRTRLGNGIPIVRRPARLDEIARRAMDELQAANPDRTLAVDVKGDVGGEWDPDRLEQVVSNLVSNAIDHGDPAAPVHVIISGEPDRVELQVRNQGAPLPPEVVSHLFEPFSRPPDEKSRKGSGLGLGLFISREIVRGHGGEIGVSSDGETVITVRLPRGGEAAAHGARPAPHRA
jgi:signal transduction histidine kinase